VLLVSKFTAHPPALSKLPCCCPGRQEEREDPPYSAETWMCPEQRGNISSAKAGRRTGALGRGDLGGAGGLGGRVLGW